MSTYPAGSQSVQLFCTAHSCAQHKETTRHATSAVKGTAPMHPVHAKQPSNNNDINATIYGVVIMA